MSLIFMSLSIALFIVMGSINQVTLQYYYPLKTQQACQTGGTCLLELNINQQMESPIYFMYEIDNFYQNHRKYIQSKSNYQLAGNTITDKHDAQICWPYITNKQMGANYSWNPKDKKPLNPDDVASPCGAIGNNLLTSAKTFFNDTFNLFDPSNTPIPINQTNISWPGDKGLKYKRSQNSEQTQWHDPQDQHFIVWMRTSGLPNFKKLWGRIQSNLLPGLYHINITNNYNSKDWEGNRYIHLTTNSIFGGKNILLPSAFLVLGIGCAIASMFFYKKWRNNKNHLE